jgi:hypothetical protein
VTSTALSSLYGGKVARQRREGKALAGNVGGQKREQTVLTPPWFIKQLVNPRLEMFMANPTKPMPGQVAEYTLALDPCTTPENPTGALVKCTGTETLTSKDGAYETPSPFDNGLLIDWKDTLLGLGKANPFVWVNPPFDALEEWLEKCAREGSRGIPIHALIPFRPHRVWFGDLLQFSKATIKSLAPFPFVGSKSAFPAPLCLCSWNITSPRYIGMPMAKGAFKNIILKEWKL